MIGGTGLDTDPMAAALEGLTGIMWVVPQKHRQKGGDLYETYGRNGVGGQKGSKYGSMPVYLEVDTRVRSRKALSRENHDEHDENKRPGPK